MLNAVAGMGGRDDNPPPAQALMERSAVLAKTAEEQRVRLERIADRLLGLGAEVRKVDPRGVRPAGEDMGFLRLVDHLVNEAAEAQMGAANVLCRIESALGL